MQHELLFDFHAHSHYSDGKHSPQEMLRRARQISLDAFSLTDHNTVRGVIELINSGLTEDPSGRKQFLPGIELSFLIGHILAIGIDPVATQKRLTQQGIPEGSVAAKVSKEQLKDWLRWSLDQGALVIAAHPMIPFGLMSVSASLLLELWEEQLIHGAESHNAQFERKAGLLGPYWHQQVSAFLAEHGIPAYANTDAHKAKHLGIWANKVSVKTLQGRSLLQALKTGTIEIRHRQLKDTR